MISLNGDLNEVDLLEYEKLMYPINLRDELNAHKHLLYPPLIPANVSLINTWSSPWMISICHFRSHFFDVFYNPHFLKEFTLGGRTPIPAPTSEIVAVCS